MKLSDILLKDFRKVFFLALSLTLMIGCDLGTKQIAYNHLKDQPIKSYLGGTLNFLFTENDGGMLSFGSQLHDDIKLLIFRLFVTIILIIMFLYIVMKKDIDKFRYLSFSLILGGGIGNLLERFFNDGKVTDFIVIEIMGVHSGIFNFADMFITFGVILLILSSIIAQYKYSKK